MRIRATHPAHVAYGTHGPHALCADRDRQTQPNRRCLTFVRRPAMMRMGGLGMAFSVPWCNPQQGTRPPPPGTIYFVSSPSFAPVRLDVPVPTVPYAWRVVWERTGVRGLVHRCEGARSLGRSVLKAHRVRSIPDKGASQPPYFGSFSSTPLLPASIHP